MMMGAPVHNLSEGCSKEAGVGRSTKRPRARPPKIGHFHDDVIPTYFAIVVLASGLELLPIPAGFRPYCGITHRTIVLKTNTGSSWMVKLKDVKCTVSMDQGWPRFSIAHDIKIDYFTTCKMLKGDVYKVTIFDYDMTEVVKWCPQHE
jgi:hypothetical protein